MSDSPHPTDVRVGHLLRERRLALGLSQERLGGLLGVTYQQVQKYERGANRIGSSRLGELCGILGVRASYFFDEEVPPGLSEGSATFEHAPLSTQRADSLALLHAFEAITSDEVRRRILDLTLSLAAASRNHPG
jgi:transcriptional regulator with XRE-family HTH domain